MTLSQLREFLARIQDEEGDIEVRFPAMIGSDKDDNETVSIEGVATVLDERNEVLYVLIGDAYTLEEFDEV